MEIETSLSINQKQLPSYFQYDISAFKFIFSDNSECCINENVYIVPKWLQSVREMLEKNQEQSKETIIPVPLENIRSKDFDILIKFMKICEKYLPKNETSTEKINSSQLKNLSQEIYFFFENIFNEKENFKITFQLIDFFNFRQMMSSLEQWTAKFIEKSSCAEIREFANLPDDLTIDQKNWIKKEFHLVKKTAPMFISLDFSVRFF